MLTLIFIRHSKPHPIDPQGDDASRPLTSNGESMAEYCGNNLNGQGLIPDLLVSSSAVRAQQTAAIIAATLNYPEDKILIEPKLYESSPEVTLDIIAGLPNDKKTIVLFGHNPIFTIVSNQLSKQCIPDVPPCGTVILTFDCEQWCDIHQSNNQSTVFEFL